MTPDSEQWNGSSTVEEQRLSREDRMCGLRTSVIAGFLGMAWYTVALGVPVTMFMECLGASAVLIGSIVTIQQAATVMQIPGALYAEKLPRRRRFWVITALAHRLVWFVPVVLAFRISERSPSTAWVMIGVTVVSSALAQFSAAPWFSWMADLIPEDIRGRFWGLRQSLLMAASLLALLGSGWVLDLFPDIRSDGGTLDGYAIVFLAAAVLGCLDILIHAFVPEPQQAPTSGTGNWMNRVRKPFGSQDFRYLTIAFGIWLFSVGLIGSFGVLYLTREYGATYRQLSAITISASLGTVASGFLFGRLMDLIGSRAFGGALMLVAPTLGSAWFFMQKATVSVVLPLVGTVVVPQAIAVLLVVNFVAGAAYGGVALCQLNLLGQFVPQKGRTMGMAVHWTAVGAIGASGPIVGGMVTDWFQTHPIDWVLPWGTQVSYLHVLILCQTFSVWFVAVPLLLRVSSVSREIPVRVLVGNPLRAAFIINGLSRMVGAASIQERVRAVRKLGHQRTGAAVSDLVDKLDDPSVDVREEAAFALGRIGTSDAVDALVDKLDDPNTDMAPQIARSLRLKPDPRSVDALVRRLDDDDRETLTESVRTLGHLGDRRASKSLLHLLDHSDDAKVVSASGEALARLGEAAAIQSMVLRMKESDNPVLKRSLAMAIGDLIGPHDGFYRLFAEEEKSRGSGASRLLRNLRRKLRKDLSTHPAETLDSLIRYSRDIERCFEEDDLAGASEALLQLGIDLAEVRYGVDPNRPADAIVEELIWRDHAFGVGIWYLHLLHTHWGSDSDAVRDWTDVLLGIYVACVECQ